MAAQAPELHDLMAIRVHDELDILKLICRGPAIIGKAWTILCGLLLGCPLLGLTNPP